LQDKAFTSEEAGAQFFIEGDTDFGTESGTEEGVFLAGKLSVDILQIERDDFTGVGCCKSDRFFSASAIGEMGKKDRFSGKNPFADSFDQRGYWRTVFLLTNFLKWRKVF